MKTISKLENRLAQLREDLKTIDIDSDEAINIYGEISDIEIKIDLLSQ